MDDATLNHARNIMVKYVQEYPSDGLFHLLGLHETYENSALNDLMKEVIRNEIEHRGLVNGGNP